MKNGSTTIERGLSQWRHEAVHCSASSAVKFYLVLVPPKSPVTYDASLTNSPTYQSSSVAQQQTTDEAPLVAFAIAIHNRNPRTVTTNYNIRILCPNRAECKQEQKHHHSSSIAL